jgi:hypothetical protein
VRDDWKLLREILGGAGDLTATLQDLSRPGALTAALNCIEPISHLVWSLNPVRRFRPLPVLRWGCGAPATGT